MLLRFVVTNFLSFAEETEFTMFPANFKIHKGHIYHTREVDLLKAAAIYGANGSGKSNFVKAVSFLREVVNSGLLTHGEAPCFRLSENYLDKPTQFEIEFSIANRYFAYGLSIFDYWVHEEWLYEISPKNDSETLIFERSRKSKNDKNKIKVNTKYLTDEKEKLRYEIYEEELVPAELFLWRIKDRIEEAHLVVKWFEHSLAVILPDSVYPLTFGLAVNQELFDYFNVFLSKSNTGIAKIEFNEVGIDTIKNPAVKRDVLNRLSDENEILVHFTDNGKEHVAYREGDTIKVKKFSVFNHAEGDTVVELRLDQQSDGSRRLLDLIPILYFIEKEDMTVFVDEIERSLHPSLIKELLELFLQNSSKGQLIFTTHESHLLDLDLFRQDEIWFTEKDESGASKIYSLSEFKPRYDLDIRKGYLAGRFGAIPFLANLKEPNWLHAEKSRI